jgi:TPR repeat protein
MGARPMGNSLKSANFLMESRLRDAARGDADACFDLGVAYSTGSGVAVDLIEAHKWFNLAAVSGLQPAQAARAEVAEDMSAREIATAQAAARAWLGVTRARAA